MAEEAEEPTADELWARLDAIDRALDGVVHLGANLLGNQEVLGRLVRQGERLESAICRGSAALQASGAYAASGAKSAGALLARQTRQPKAAAYGRVRLGEQLRRLPATAAAFAEGEIGAAQARLIASLEPPEEGAARDELEARLLDSARRVGLDDLGRLIALEARQLDASAAEEAARRRRELRRVWLRREPDGTWRGGATLDPVSGEIVGTELDRLVNELYAADLAEAAARLGREPLAGDLIRTAAQRRADALVEMATRSAALREDAPRPIPLFSVIVDYSSFEQICELGSGAPVTPGDLAPYFDPSQVERAVFRTPTRAEVSPRSRFFVDATRRAVELRDRRCTIPGCDEPANVCEVDHIVPYAEGGETTQENGRLLCHLHNRQRSSRRERGGDEDVGSGSASGTPDESSGGEASIGGGAKGRDDPPPGATGTQAPQPGGNRRAGR